MRFNRTKIIFLLFGVLLCTCIDPYKPNLAGYETLLVVDAMITDENSAYTVNLSRTFQDSNVSSEKVTDASVSITDELNNNYSLSNYGNGIYKTDSTQFTGKIGKKYTLHIQAGNGEEYESDPCTMYPVTDLDSLYYVKDQELTNNNTENHDGIRIFCNLHSEANSYLRWSFEETWKFRVPFPKKYNYVDSAHINIVDKIKEYCWKNRKSDEILISSNYSGENLLKQPVLFIASDQSDRLLLKYSILVKQYSISKDEYDFWDNLKKVGDMGGDIFAAQPFSVISNIHSLKNANSRVLGYFQVSAVKQKRKYIDFTEIAKLDLPAYHYSCVRFARGPQDYPGSGWTFQKVYNGFPPSSGFVFIEPVYTPVAMTLERLVFTTFECANCELAGTSVRPSFWPE